MTDTTTETVTPVPWFDRVLEFQNSGLSRKNWCVQNSVPLSTLSYWIRKYKAANTNQVSDAELVFAKLPSGQELCCQTESDTSPIVIRIAENIRIEISADCPERLLASMLQVLKGYA